MLPEAALLYQVDMQGYRTAQVPVLPIFLLGLHSRSVHSDRVEYHGEGADHFPSPLRETNRRLRRCVY